MNKTKEQLAEEHASSLYPDKYQDAPYTTRGDLFVLAEDSYKKGYEAATPKWTPIDRSSKMPNTGIVMILFDNGDIRNYKDKNLPFAVATHYIVLPNPPKQ